MKGFILFALLCLSANANAQSQTDTIITTGNGAFVSKTGEYIAPDGAKLTKGDILVLGPSAGNNGEYMNIMTKSYLTGGIPLRGSWEGSKFKVKDIYLSGSEEYGYVAILRLGNSHYGKYYCTIDGAIKTGEIRILK